MDGVTMTFGFQRFTKFDWMAYGGAEPFEDGSDPLLSTGDVLVDDEVAQIIVDGSGVSLHWWVDDEPYRVHALAAEGARLLALLRPKMTYRDLTALPGVRIDRI